MAWAPYQWGYHVQTALRSIKATPVMQAVAVSTIAVALLVLGGFLLLLVNVERLSRDWGQEIKVIAFLAEDASEQRLEEIRAQVEQWPEVAAVQVKTRHAALADFKESLGADKGVLDGVDPSVMPASVELSLEPEHRDEAGLAEMAARLSGIDSLGEVEQVVYGRTLLERIKALRELLRMGGIVVAVFVLFAVAFIISNTIRLGLYARRDELEIMQLVGATEGFIRAPYYLEGVLQGLLGAATGIVLLWAVFMMLAPGEQAVVDLQLGRIKVYFLDRWLIAALFAGGAALGALASHVSVNRFLRAREPLD
ncbi:MAG: cell division protein FtsX [Bradymonadia bacterium]